MNAPPKERLIFDRTLNDIMKRTSKGYFNLEDAQRIAAWIKYLSDELKLGLSVYQFTFAEDLTRPHFQSIIDNVARIKAAMPKANDEPDTPIALAWDFGKENDLEKILQIAWDFYYSRNIDKLYSGTFRAGNHVKFRQGVGY